MKRVRDKVVSEALLMAHAITLKDFFLQPVAQRLRPPIDIYCLSIIYLSRCLVTAFTVDIHFLSIYPSIYISSSYLCI